MPFFTSSANTRDVSKALLSLFLSFFLSLFLSLFLYLFLYFFLSLFIYFFISFFISLFLYFFIFTDTINQSSNHLSFGKQFKNSVCLFGFLAF